MPDLATWANIAEVVGGVAVVSGLAYAAVEMRRTRRERTESAALEIVRAGQSNTFGRAINILYSAPVVTTEAYEADPELRRAVEELWTYYETVGYLVYKRVVPLQIFDECAGGGLRVLWSRCKEWAQAKRSQPGHENAWEWVEWLYDQVTRQPAPGKAEGAHVAHRDWRP